MRHRTSFLSLFASVLMLLGSSVAVGAAHASQHDYVIDTTADAGDVDPGDGACDDGAGTCSLRAAIMEANALPGAHAISLPAGTYILTIPGTGEDAAASGDLDITGDLTIDGAGADSSIIDANGIDRVFQVLPGMTVKMDGVTVRNGNLRGPGGGISNRGAITLTNSVVTDSTGGHGGGIFNNGTMTLTDSTVSDSSGDGGVYSSADGLGGGIFNNGTMTVNRSTVSGNTAPGVYWFPVGGGGIFNSRGTMTLTHSTVSGNTAGTGVVNLNGSLTVQNSTISGNTGNTGYGGGGLINFSFHGHATTSVSSSTIAENTNLAGRGHAIAVAFSPAGSLTVKNSILAGPTAGAGGDCYGGVTSLGHNLASDNSCGLSGSGDLNNTNPLLGPLADDGGPTETHPLLSGSPAIDAVPLASCAVSTDQRGVARPQGSACDIGAYELVADLKVDIVIKPGNGPNSVNPRSRGNIPVAILSTADFDAANEVDREVLTFGASGDEDSLHLRGGRNAAPNCGVEDVNGDSLDDLVCQFQTQETGFEHGDTEGVLKGQTVDGMAIIGTDSATMVGRP